VIARPLNTKAALPAGVRFDTLGMLMRVLNELGELSRSSILHDERANAINAQRRIMEVTMHLHELQPKEETHTNLSKTPEFAELRAAILAALQPFPEALRAVTAAMAPRPRGDS
jgi:hypothetical protein